MTSDEAVDLIRDAGFGMLATVEGNQPRVRPMMPYLTEDNELIVALLGRSRTITQVKANENIEICFVDRKMWYCRIAGKGIISEDKEKKEILWNNIPMLKQYFGGIEDPNFVLMEVKITEAEAMTPHDKTPTQVEIKN
ncbi:MAG: pyridoxamine 5'-phosphate oxidase family protein [Candidatus Omnitrophica bacterium]|nr:pyridoxamine 5'-phosphate oxidase family protein [Candidatus Omnitrophota bacterium]